MRSSAAGWVADMRGAHVCMSGNLECSGVDPCDPCASATLTYVLVPAMKAAGIDQRNDPRVTHFLQTYAEARRRLLQGLIAQAVPAQPPPMPPRPSRPPVADLPLTEAELEAMASPAPHAAVPTVVAPAATLAADIPLAEEPPYTEAPTPAGLMTDEEFASKFPKAAPEELMEMPPKPVTPEPEPVSLLKLASDAITPKLPAEQPASDSSEVGSAPTEPAPLPAVAPKAPTDDVSAVPESARNLADTTVTKAEASSHG